MKIHISDDDKPNSDEENSKSGNTSQSAKSGISSELTQENIFLTLDDLERCGNDIEYQKRLNELSPPLRKAYFSIRYHIYPKPQITSPSKSQVASSNITVNEVSCLETKVDQQPELVKTPPVVERVVSLTAENKGNKEKNKRKRKSEAAQVSLSGVVAKLNECFNEINSVWAQNPRNTSLSLIPAEILKVRELVSDELEKFTESDD